MKKSEELLLASQQEANDLKAMAIYNKAIREKRVEKFEETYLPLLESKMKITYKPSMGAYVIVDHDNKFYTFYPKANKIQRWSDAKWFKPGLKWIMNNLFNV